MKAYTIQRGNKCISYNTIERKYIIGFKSVLVARRVQFSIQPEPEISLIRGKQFELSDNANKTDKNHLEFVLDTEACLFIPKCKGSIYEPLNDGGFHMGIINFDEFIRFPFTKGLGIIMPYEVFEESEEEFIFTSYVIDPIFNPNLFELPEL
jgi:hypothetical protein